MWLSEERAGIGSLKEELRLYASFMPHDLRNWSLICPLSLASFLLPRAQLCCCVSLKVLLGTEVSCWHMPSEQGFALINTSVAAENRSGQWANEEDESWLC